MPSDFLADFRELLAKHGISAPRFAHGSRLFDPAKPSALYSGPVYDQEELVAATAALVEGSWSVAGEYVHRFEAEFSKYLGQEAAVMVNSGSSANLVLLAAAKLWAGWNDGDGVVVSPVGFPTTISAITISGLRPVFVDIEWDTLNADTEWIERRLCEDRTIRAILVSPVLANPPDLDRLCRVCEKHSVALLMDGCDSLGSLWRGRHLSHYAVATTCSFFASHHISTLQGGMITSNDRELIRIARQLVTWGRECTCTGAANLLPKGGCGRRFDRWLPSQPDLIVDHKYVFGLQGYNLQPLDLQGALGLEQLRKVDWIHRRRRAAWERLQRLVLELPQLRTAAVLSGADPSWFGVPLICPSYPYKLALTEHLESHGVQTRNYFSGNILLHPGYERLGAHADYPNADQVLRRVLFIGTNPTWTEEHFQHIARTMGSFVP